MTETEFERRFFAVTCLAAGLSLVAAYWAVQWDTLPKLEGWVFPVALLGGTPVALIVAAGFLAISGKPGEPKFMIQCPTRARERLFPTSLDAAWDQVAHRLAGQGFQWDAVTEEDLSNKHSHVQGFLREQAPLLSRLQVQPSLAEAGGGRCIYYGTKRKGAHIHEFLAHSFEFLVILEPARQGTRVLVILSQRDTLLMNSGEFRLLDSVLEFLLQERDELGLKNLPILFMNGAVLAWSIPVMAGVSLLAGPDLKRIALSVAAGSLVIGAYNLWLWYSRPGRLLGGRLLAASLLPHLVFLGALAFGLLSGN